jgi:transcriptional regulator with XRE-family HTH domain
LIFFYIKTDCISTQNAYTVINGKDILTIQEKIRILLVRRGNLSEAELARRLGVLPQNFSRKMEAGKFTNADLEKIAAILDCTVTHAKPVFRMNDTGEEI